MNWFGSPWPSAELRAPVCDDDTLRVDPPPPGEECVLCGEVIVAGDSGVMMPHISADMQHVYRYSHIDCLLTGLTGERP